MGHRRSPWPYEVGDIDHQASAGRRVVSTADFKADGRDGV